MRKYGDVAVQAARILQSSPKSAEDAWRRTAAKVFVEAPAARAKTCPRETFLGLCQEGLIKGVPASSCLSVDGRKNREYGVAAARILASSPALAGGSKGELWRRVLLEVGADPAKQHNCQLDVVLSLVDAGLIRLPKRTVP